MTVAHLTLATVIAAPAVLAAQLVSAAPIDAPLSIVRVDSLERIYPDMPPHPASPDGPLCVPRGATATFQFGVISQSDAVCALSAARPTTRDGGILAGDVGTYEVISVPVEANNNGGSKSGVGRIPPESWLKEFVRKAPFEVAEVMAPADRFQARAGVVHAVLVEVHVAPDAEPGVYSSSLRVTAGEASVRAPFALRVYKTTVGDQMAMHSTHWFFPEPENLTSGERPQWWTQRHWELIENSGRALRAFGQDTILTPLVDYEESLIQVTRQEDGTYSFDYSRFDRWMNLFIDLGFRRFAGHHVSMLPEKWVYTGVFFTDAKTGKKERLVEHGRGTQEWLEFIPTLYSSLYAHLKEKGWVELYLQHQLDEPKDGELYEKLAALARKHMPGVRTIDAINSRPEVFSPLVDVQVFALTILAKQQKLAEERRQAGQAVWLYHCCSPYPPYPNRHLDERLTDSRLYPWLAYLLKADGYLYWGANIYRGADPYKTSVGPVPNGSQDPGHPPGDNWFFYRGPDGLLGSMRMAAFRDGMLDHALLTMLAHKDPAKADAIMHRVARSIKDYQKDAAAFHQARRHLLEALDEE